MPTEIGKPLPESVLRSLKLTCDANNPPVAKPLADYQEDGPWRTLGPLEVVPPNHVRTILGVQSVPVRGYGKAPPETLSSEIFKGIVQEVPIFEEVVGHSLVRPSAHISSLPESQTVFQAKSKRDRRGGGFRNWYQKVRRGPGRHGRQEDVRQSNPAFSTIRY